MTAEPVRPRPDMRQRRRVRTAVLMTVVGTLLLSGLRAGRADPPTPAEVTRYLEWYQHLGRPTPWPTPLNPGPPPPLVTTDPPWSPEVVHDVEWYKYFGAPRPRPAPATSQPLPPIVRTTGDLPLPHRTAPAPLVDRTGDNPWPDDAISYRTIADPPWSPEVVHYVEWYKHLGAPRPRPASATPQPQPPIVRTTDDPPPDDPTRYLEAYQHHGIPQPRPAPGQRGPTPPVVITFVDVQSICEGAVQPVSVPAPSSAQNSVPAPLPPLATEPPFAPPVAAEVTPVGCSTCGQGGGLLFPGPSSGAAAAGPADGCGCGTANCVPGRANCVPCTADTAVGRFLCGVYDCICCPDPCYEPKWIPLADSAFFVESARPQTQQRLRWDSGFDLNHPDAGEFFWAQADGKGRGPNPANHNHAPGVLGETNVNYNQLSLYTEGAIGNIGTFVEMPYLSLDGDVMGHAANFGDMNLGTKTLLFDCELLQVAFEFRTYLPTGNFTKGLGTGHVSLEPGLLVGIKLGPDTYFQGQVAEWIPLGGDPNYQGAILHYHTSVNQLLCRILPTVPLIGTVEFNGWSFQHGEFTDPDVGGGQRITGETYVSVGPGLRLFICDKVDFGVGMAFALTDRHWAEQLYRSELRWRY